MRTSSYVTKQESLRATAKTSVSYIYCTFVLSYSTWFIIIVLCFIELSATDKND